MHGSRHIQSRVVHYQSLVITPTNISVIPITAKNWLPWTRQRKLIQIWSRQTLSKIINHQSLAIAPECFSVILSNGPSVPCQFTKKKHTYVRTHARTYLTITLYQITAEITAEITAQIGGAWRGCPPPTYLLPPTSPTCPNQWTLYDTIFIFTTPKSLYGTLVEDQCQRVFRQLKQYLAILGGRECSRLKNMPNIRPMASKQQLYPALPHIDGTGLKEGQSSLLGSLS